MTDHKTFNDVFKLNEIDVVPSGTKLFSLNTSYLETLCEELVIALNSLFKLNISDDELKTLKLISYLQLEAKICNTRRYSSPEGMKCDWKRVGDTENRFRLALFPIEFYLKQIGGFKYQDWNFNPKSITVSYTKLNETLNIPYENLSSRYEEFLDKIDEINPQLRLHAFREINFEAPGTKAQFVTSIKNQNFPGSYHIWCNMNIDEYNFKIGFHLGFGFELNENTDRKFELCNIASTVYNTSKNSWFIKELFSYSNIQAGMQRGMQKLKIHDFSDFTAENTIDDFFTSTKINKSIPVQGFSLNTAYLKTICTELIEEFKRRYYMYKITDTEIESLMLVSYLQLETKIYIAQQDSTFFKTDAPISEYIKTVQRTFKNAFDPISIYLSQIGKFEFDNQIFVPKEITVGYKSLIEHSSIPFDEFSDKLFYHYHQLERKVYDYASVSDVDFVAPGNVSQLVTSRSYDPNTKGYEHNP